MSETLREPTAASALESVLTVQMSPARLTFHVHATETWSPSGSLVVVVAVRLSFVFGEAGLNVGAVRLGARFAVTVVVAVAELLPVMLSLGEITDAVFERVAAVPGALTTMSKLAEVPAASDGRVHVTVDVPEQVHPVPLAETKVVATGIVSVTLSDVAATVLELFVTLIVYVRFAFVWTGSGESVFVIERSAT